MPTGTPIANPILATAVALPPMGKYTFACNYTSQRNAGNVGFIFNPVSYTPIAKAEIHPAFGKYIARKLAIDIPLVLLGDYHPKIGDSFLDMDDRVYNVVDCQNTSLFFQRVVGLCPEISFPLEDAVQYRQASCAGGSLTGSRTVTHANVGDPVAAAVQPMDAELGNLFGTKNFKDHFVIYLAVDPSGTGFSVMRAGDLFVDQHAVIYEIQRVFERNRLDFLAAFDCCKKL